HVLRFWEENFPQLNPLKRKGGRRLYSVNDINLLRRIKELLHEEGYTVKGVKTYLSKKKISDIKEEGKLKLSRELSNKLLQMKETLQNIKKLYD
ncbi:MAG: MerR family transcriptional regulator, partial [Pseudomonadota bacterium]|nr:MerR family transcriptional regulator [Pseudomonadota bacterium]